MFMGPEGILFALPATFAGSALAQIQKQSLALPAIFSAAVLNVVQVGVGLTQFGPLREASLEVEGLSPAAGSVVAFSFFSLPRRQGTNRLRGDIRWTHSLEGGRKSPRLADGDC
jgi:hypothetical protein